MTELFHSNQLQFQLVLSYVHELNKYGHTADIDFQSTIICHVIVIYRQGIQVMSVFSERGFNMVGAFVKHSSWGNILVACLRNCNNEIQIVSVTWVSGEKKNNWSRFFEHLTKVITRPAVFIPDRYKGLVPAP